MALITGDPPELDFEAYANEAWICSLEFLNADDETPYDLTDLAFSLQLRRLPESATLDLELSTATGELFVDETDPANGVLNILAPVAAVRRLSGIYAYDLLVWRAAVNETARIWLRGKITVGTGVTRDAS
ncbi:hypothetical protein [Afifella sp. YEN Y35]|uniref:hypothetical protein n=1 Tax=Afifella sp. YEN Y35 TaxID=3388337 RepID=UPI0039E1CB30